GGEPYQLLDDAGLPIHGTRPVWSPVSDQIAFEWLGSIHLTSEVGGYSEVLVPHTSGIPYSTWGSEGKWIYFWNRVKADMYIISVVDGTSEPLNLIPTGEEVAGLSFSEENSELYYSRGPFGGNKTLWSVGIDPGTGKPRRPSQPLTNLLSDDIQCSVSPDGTQIAFVVRELERHLQAASLSPADGFSLGEPTQITSRGRQNYYPTVDREGRRLVWTSHRYSKGVLFSKILGSNDEVKVTQDWGKTTREINACFSLDGRLSYVSSQGGAYEIYRMLTWGGASSQVTDVEHPVRDATAVLSPDGQTYLTYSNRAGNWDIWAIPVNNPENAVQLTTWGSDEMYPCWSPDGNSVAFTSNRNGNADIWTCNSDGSNKQEYVVGPSIEGWSAWSADGSNFFFTSDRSGVFNIWVMSPEEDVPQRLTNYSGFAEGMPEDVLYTKFAITSTSLIFPREVRRGDIWILESFH
ncbi:TolB family protein, partial [Gemmatimonadota bacterium]